MNIFLNIQIMTDQFIGNYICIVNMIRNLIKTEKLPLVKKYSMRTSRGMFSSMEHEATH